MSNLINQISNDSWKMSINMIRNAVENLWSEHCIVQYFTDHGIKHCERVAGWSEKLLLANKGRPLSEKELYLLLAGIYLHDIGMQCDVLNYPLIKEKAEQLGAHFDNKFEKKDNGLSSDEQNEVRANHHFLTAAWIDYVFNKEYLQTELERAIKTIPEDFVFDLIDICKYHSQLPIEVCGTFCTDGTTRKQLLAALLRFSDEMDINYERVTFDTVKNFIINPDNALYWWLHSKTKLNILGENIISLIVMLHPDDVDKHGIIIKKCYFEKFIEKNRRLTEILKSNNIYLGIDFESGIKSYPYTEKLPAEIVSALDDIQEKATINDTIYNIPVQVVASGKPDVQSSDTAQKAADVIITETAAGSLNSQFILEKQNALVEEGNLFIKLPQGIRFANMPTITVVSGDIFIRTVGIDYSNGYWIRIKVKSSSKKASTIKISNIKLIIDKTALEGDIDLKIGSYDWVVKVAIANCKLTSSEPVTNVAIFNILDSSYTINGKTVPMDVRLYIANSRVYFPVRYVANAVGVADANCIWDEATQKFTIIKGDRVVQLTLGSKELLINGATVTMDVAPEMHNGHVWLPVAWIAMALGATVSWNVDDQTISITY